MNKLKAQKAFKQRKVYNSANKIQIFRYINHKLPYKLLKINSFMINNWNKLMNTFGFWRKIIRNYSYNFSKNINNMMNIKICLIMCLTLRNKIKFINRLIEKKFQWNALVY